MLLRIVIKMYILIIIKTNSIYRFIWNSEKKNYIVLKSFFLLEFLIQFTNNVYLNQLR